MCLFQVVVNLFKRVGEADMVPVLVAFVDSAPSLPPHVARYEAF